MKLIQASGEFNSRELIKNACKYLNLDEEFTQKMISKYREDSNRYIFSIYLNDKNNLILEKNTLRVYLKDSSYKKAYDFAVEVGDGSDIATRVNRIRYMKGMLKSDKIESIYFRRHRIIITEDGRVYTSRGNKIRRVSKAELTSYSGSYVAKTIWNPYYSDFNALNSLTIHAFDLLQREKSKYTMRVTLQSGSINSDTTYFDEMKSRLPMVYYLRGWEAPCHDLLVPNPDLPLYIKKLFVEEDDSKYSITNGIIMKNEAILKAYRLTKSLKFKNADVIRSFVSKFAEGDSYRWTSITPQLKTYYKHLKEMYEGKVKNIELLLVNRLDFNKHNQTCLDSIRMFYDALRCREEYPDKFFKKLDYEYLLKNSLKDIHDKLSLITRDDKIAMKYKEYNLEKDLPIFEKEIEGYQFLMPRNSAEIIRLVDIMHNCVASYDDKMAKGSSKIIYACNNQDVINYIKTGEGDPKYLDNAIENGDIPAPACIEIGRKKVRYSDAIYGDPSAAAIYGDPSGEDDCNIEMRQCYAPHNRLLSIDNPELDSICNKYWESIKDKDIESITEDSDLFAFELLTPRPARRVY